MDETGAYHLLRIQRKNHSRAIFRLPHYEGFQTRKNGFLPWMKTEPFPKQFEES